MFEKAFLECTFYQMFSKYRQQRKYRKEYRQNQKAVKKRLKIHENAIRKSIKSEYRNEKILKVRKFLEHPLAPKELTPEQQLKRDMLAEASAQRRERKSRWWKRFRKNPVKALFVREKTEEQLQLEQWWKENRKQAAAQKIKTNIRALREILTTGDLRKRFWLGMIQSSAIYILAFLVIYILYQLITILVSEGFNIPTIWYYYRVKFPLFTGSHLYTRIALISIFAAGPMLSLIVAFLFLRQYFNRKIISPNLKLFFLWGFLSGINMFFGSYIVGFITRTEFIYASEWIFMSSMFDVEEIIFTVISFTISLLIGRLATPLFLLCAGSTRLIEPRFRLFYVITHVFIPWIIGTVVFWILTSPVYYIPFTMKTITPVIILFPTLLSYNSLRYTNIHMSGVVRRNYFRWSIVVIVIAILFFYRILLNFGLHFF